MTLLRAMSPAYSSDEAILQAFYEAEDIERVLKAYEQSKNPAVERHCAKSL